MVSIFLAVGLLSDGKSKEGVLAAVCWRYTFAVLTFGEIISLSIYISRSR